MKNDTYYMELALKEAEKAYQKDEVPVGCVIVKDGVVIASAHNLKETSQVVIDHAELLAIKKACKKLSSWRLDGCQLYVTLEPCPMCAGAIIQSRIQRVIYGTQDPKGGCFGSLINFDEIKGFNHYPMITSEICKHSCQKILKEFFKNKR